MATEKRLVPKAARCMHHAKSFCRYLGVTEPISILESNDREKEVTVTLMEELRRQNTFESEEESRRR
jgi:poly(A) polymerase Pap1